MLQEPSPLVLTGLAIFLSWLISYCYSEAWRLRKFPTVGSALPLLSIVGTFKYVLDSRVLVATGMRKWPGRNFKIPSPTGWHVVITSPKLIEDIKKAPDHVLSHRLAISQMLQIRFVVPRRIVENPFHVPLIKSHLTRALTTLVPAVYDEVVDACTQYLPAQDEWACVKLYGNMTNIVARASNRIFVGQTLCRNPAWIELCIDHTAYVAKASVILPLLPSFLRSFVISFNDSKVANHKRLGIEFLKPVIDARRKEKAEGESSIDFLSWIMDEAKGDDGEDGSLFERIMGLNFAATHTSSMAITHTLFDLAANPEYLKPLREEVEEVTNREGWTKAALDQMHKVDSFVKESQRLHPVGVLLLSRYALEDFTFSDGTTIPAGSIVGVPSNMVHQDPNTYENPTRFDGFRFVKMKERVDLDGEVDKKFDLVTINSDFLGFGQGKHACPGRFFAAAEIKLLLAYIVTNYDVKLEDGAERPPDFVLMSTSLPSRTAEVYFRKRQSVL